MSVSNGPLSVPIGPTHHRSSDSRAKPSHMCPGLSATFISLSRRSAPSFPENSANPPFPARFTSARAVGQDGSQRCPFIWHKARRRVCAPPCPFIKPSGKRQRRELGTGNGPGTSARLGCVETRVRRSVGEGTGGVLMRETRSGEEGWVRGLSWEALRDRAETS